MTGNTVTSMNEQLLHQKLWNIQQAPAYDEKCDPYCSSDRANGYWSKKLLYRPHVRLNFRLNMDPLAVKKEVLSVAGRWTPYNNDALQKRGAGVSNYWQALFLRNFSHDSGFGFGETKDYLKMMDCEHYLYNGRCKPEYLVQTDLWKNLPCITGMIEKLVTLNMCDRILITRVSKNQRVNWHSHCYYEKEYTHAYIHVPLLTSTKTEMMVYMGGKIHSKHYSFNSVWIINTQHNHAVNNLKGDDRYHLLILASFEDPKLDKVLQNTK